MNNVIKVGMADLNIAKAPNYIRTSGLGSCVGVAIYDPKRKIAGLAHVMLPSSELSRGELNEAKYADTAIPLLLRKLDASGGNIRHYQAKMAGGAQMFALSGSQSMRIGERNAEACRALLYTFNIPILGEDLGGNFGRTIEMDPATGILQIRTVNKGVKDV